MLASALIAVFSNLPFISFVQSVNSVFNCAKFAATMPWYTSLTSACDIETGREVLIPAVEQGPETDWLADDLGFPWVFPLSVFWRL